MDELKAAVETELRDFLAERRSAVPEATELIDELERLISAGGKRLRPAFCYWGYRCSGRPHCAEIVRAAASLELLHTFAIVHDDIMDDSDERRGEPTVHVRHGVGFALLAGDLALVLADELFFNAGFGHAAFSAAFDAYSLMRQEVIAGQHLDVRNARRREIGEAEARRVAVLKSGRYSIEKPLVLGGLLGGAPAHVVQALSKFGDPLGEAFQLRDDLLGVFGDRASVGKPVDSDIREGKRNLLYASAVRLLRGEERSFFLSRWGGSGLTDSEVDRLRALIESSGARAAVEARLDERTADARSALEVLSSMDGARGRLGTTGEATASGFRRTAEHWEALSDLVIEATYRDI
jgi:geranylgeranyl diphosphate synthase type I